MIPTTEMFEPASRGMLAAAAVACVVALASPAFGQQKSDTERAKQHYKRGMQAFYADDYAMAITNFKRAHSIRPSGTLLYNISIAYSRMEKPEEALEYSEKAAGYDDLPRDTVVKNDARTVGYTVALRAERLLPDSEPAARTRADGAGTRSEDRGSRPADSGSGHTLRWVGAGVGIAGLGLLAGARVVNFNTQNKIDEKRAAEKSGNLERANELYDQIETQQQTGRILLYAGGGAAVVGATLFVIDLASSGSSKDRAVRVTGGPRPNGWSLGLRAAF